jgi:mxaK protein
MAVRRSVANFAFGSATIVCVLFTAYQAGSLLRSSRINAAIASAEAAQLDANVPEARFARALALAQAGKSEEALKVYKSLSNGPRSEMRNAALYNAANLYMRDALKHGDDESFKAIPLVELAKQSYRDLLRGQPDNWDARYNLERALLLSPEEEEEETDDSDAPSKEQRVLSKIQGEAIDLP